MSASHDPPQPLREFFDLLNEALCCLNLVSAFVSPRALSAAQFIPAQQDMLRHLALYLEFVEKLKSTNNVRSNQRIVDAEPHARRLVHLFSRWVPDLQIPDEIISTSRALLETAITNGPPPWGWDNFEGFPEQGW